MQLLYISLTRAAQIYLQLHFCVELHTKKPCITYTRQRPMTDDLFFTLTVTRIFACVSCILVGLSEIWTEEELFCAVVDPGFWQGGGRSVEWPRPRGVKSGYQGTARVTGNKISIFRIIYAFSCILIVFL